MKRFLIGISLFSFLIIVGCSVKETKSEELLPEGIPEFVQESDFDKIDWNKKAVTFDRNMIGNENKLGVIGMDQPSLHAQKWMWHLWGIDHSTNPTLTVVGFHKETGTVHPILSTGWSMGLSGPNNGADAHTPSTVTIPKAGEWAFILYTDENIFDILVTDITE